MQQGGQVSTPALAAIDGGTTSDYPTISADGSGSTIDVSGLASISAGTGTDSGPTATTTNQGTILDGNLTASTALG